MKIKVKIPVTYVGGKAYPTFGFKGDILTTFREYLSDLKCAKIAWKNASSFHRDYKRHLINGAIICKNLKIPDMPVFADKGGRFVQNGQSQFSS